MMPEKCCRRDDGGERAVGKATTENGKLLIHGDGQHMDNMKNRENRAGESPVPPLSRRVFCASAMGVMTLCCCSCWRMSAGTEERLILTGSSTVAPLAQELGKAFERRHPGVRVDVQTGGSSRGIADARRGLNDIGMVSRSLKPAENDLHAFPVARDGICLIVHRNNPVRELSVEQIIGIYRGEIRNWKEVGGPDASITVVHKAAGRSTLELFLKFFRLKNRAVKPDVVIGDNEQGIKVVAGNPHAIGYVSIGTAEFDARGGTPIRLLPLNGVPASVANVRNGTFPLMRTLHFVTREKPTGRVKQFLDFARSPAVRGIIEEQSFVPLEK